ncbi:unnamed protein product [Closterium sp. NIES-53]
MASPSVLTFDAEGRAVDFEVWLDDLQLFLQCDSKDGLSLFDLTSGASTAPAADADSTVRSQWTTRDAAARLAVRSHLPSTERAHFSQYKSAKTLYDAVVARYSSLATAALSRLMLPDTRYRAALPAELCAKNPPPMYITLYYLVTRLPDTLRSVRDHFLSLCPTTLTVDLLEERLLAAETSITAVGASRGDPRTPFFEGCSPVPLLPSVASAATVDLVGTESVSAASAPSERRRNGKGERGKGAGGGCRGGGSGGRGGGGGGGGGGGKGGGFGGSGGGGGGGVGGGWGGGGGGGSGGGGAGRGSESPPVAASGLVAASSQVFAAASRSGPESAPYSCRLLSTLTLLWHHRLGHPSLPRLRGMASRVLGHERYFLLVVDDYLRYTTVFPLRRKDEVIEVLIDWIRVARLQLRERFGSDFPVLRLHSDKGGEFSSDLLRAFCRAEGIHQTFTLPASPQKNGIAKRRIGMVMDVARTSMIHAATPHFLWPFAVQYAAHQINLQPRVSLPETSPTLRWTVKVGDASAFRVWGSRAFIRDLSADKLSSRAVPCVFLGFPPDAPGWQFYHPTSRRVLSSQDVTFDESVLYYHLFPYRTAPLPPPHRSSSRAVDAVEPVEVAVDSGASGGAEPERAEPGGAGSGGAEPERAEPGGAASGGAVGAGGSAAAGGTGAGGAAGAGAGGSASAGGAGATGPGGARTGGTGAAGPGGAPGAGATCGAGAGGATEVGTIGGTGAGATVSASGPAGGGATGVGADAGGAGAVPAGSGGAARLRPYFVPLLEQVLGLPPSSSPSASLECPPPVQSESQLQLAFPLPAPSPYVGPTGGLAKRREPESRLVSPFLTARTIRRAPRQRPPAVPGTHPMALRPSTAPHRVPLPSPPESSLPALAEPASDSLHAASPTVTRLLATAVTDPSFESAAASTLVAELVDFTAHCRLDYAASLVAESASVCPPFVGGECALSTDVLEDRQEEFQCFAATLPHLVSLLLAPEGDPDAPDIPTPRSYAEAIEGPYSSQWQAAMRGSPRSSFLCSTPFHRRFVTLRRTDRTLLSLVTSAVRAVDSICVVA